MIRHRDYADANARSDEKYYKLESRWHISIDYQAPSFPKLIDKLEKKGYRSLEIDNTTSAIVENANGNLGELKTLIKEVLIEKEGRALISSVSDNISHIDLSVEESEWKDV